MLGFPRQLGGRLRARGAPGDVGLPPSVDEDLSANLKPRRPRGDEAGHRHGGGRARRPRAAARYVNFYANLRNGSTASSRRSSTASTADAGDPTPLGRRTVVVRFSDHGEMGLAHGGLRQKAFNVYEETIRVPLIFSNPSLAPEARSCPHPASLVNLVPTIAGLTGAEPAAGTERDRPLAPATRPRGPPPVQDEVLFTFDDMHAGTGQVADILPGVPGRIRCIRERRFKYARYFRGGTAPGRVRDVRPRRGPPRAREPRPPGPPPLRRSGGARRARATGGEAAALEERLARPCGR